MTKRPAIVHLLDDLSLGGVTKSLELFQHPALNRHYESSVEAVHPNWSIAPKFDASIIVIHFSASWKTLPFLYSLSARNSAAKLILVEHSYSREWEEIHVTERARFRAMLKLAYKIFDRVVCVSKAQASWLEEAADLQASKRDVIYPWSEMKGLAQLPRPLFSVEQPITIGAYGRFVEDKGFERLIIAINMLPDGNKVKLMLGGFGPDEQKLKKLAALNPNISFYGKVKNVADFLGKCDAVAVPSKYEAYGLVATEARLAARPILVSHVGGLPEQVGDAGLSIDFGDEVAVTELLQNLQTSPLADMSVAGREACLQVTEDRIKAWLDMLSALKTSTERLKAA